MTVFVEVGVVEDEVVVEVVVASLKRLSCSDCSSCTEVGRDSILQKSMSRREKQAIALYNAPIVYVIYV